MVLVRRTGLLNICLLNCLNTAVCKMSAATPHNSPLKLVELDLTWSDSKLVSCVVKQEVKAKC